METETGLDKDKEAIRRQWEDVRLKIARIEATRKSSFCIALFFGILGGMFGGFHAHDDLHYQSPLAIGGMVLAAAWPTFWLVYARLQKGRWGLQREEKALRFRLTGEDIRNARDYMNPLALNLLLIASIIFSALVFLLSL